MDISVFYEEVRAYGGGYVQARIVSPYPRELFDRWRNEGRIGQPDTPLVFKVWPKAKHPDVYFTGLHTPLYSARVVRIFDEFQVKMEKYPVKLEGADSTHAKLDTGDYYLCRLRHIVKLTTPVKDPKSFFPVDYEVDQQVLQTVPPLFFDPEVGDPLIRWDLKEALLAANVSGCEFKSLRELASSMN